MNKWVVFLFVFITAKKGESFPPPDRSYKILMLLPFGSKSHYNVFLPLTQGLLYRGHKVWMLSPHPPLNVHPNFTELNHHLPGLSDIQTNIFALGNDVFKWTNLFSESMMGLSRKMYEVDSVKKLYEMKDEFDVVIFSEPFSEAAFPFLDGKITIALATPGLSSLYSNLQGNVINPAYRNIMGLDFPKPLSFKNRFFSFFTHIVEPLFWSMFLDLYNVERELRSRFPSMPSILNLRKNVSLVLSNSHFSIDHPFPLLPNQVEVGAMHCRPASPLPVELDTWLNASESGAIYFSLGSIVRGNMMTNYHRNLFIEAFKQIDQNVLWKFEEEIENLPSNVFIKHWLPQHDILAHPNVKLFITHAGLLSTQESIFHGTPMLALPLYADQFRNSLLIEDKKFGLSFEWDNLDLNTLVSGIRQIIDNSIYREHVALASKALRDQPSSPIDTAIWWTEYVIRNEGAPQIKSPGADISNIEYFMIDVILFIHVIFFFIYWLCKKLVKRVLKMCVVNSNDKIKVDLKYKIKTK